MNGNVLNVLIKTIPYTVRLFVFYECLSMEVRLGIECVAGDDQICCIDKYEYMSQITGTGWPNGPSLVQLSNRAHNFLEHKYTHNKYH